MLYKPTYVIGTESVHDVEEVVAVREPALREFVWEVLHEVVGASNLGPQVLHGKLVIERNVDEPNVFEFQKFLVLGKDLLEKIFVDHGVTWDVELDYKAVRTE